MFLFGLLENEGDGEKIGGMNEWEKIVTVLKERKEVLERVC
jgi:hypothetical protein